MNPDELARLRIASEVKKRSGRSTWMIVVGVVAITGVALYFAKPWASEETRLLGGESDRTKNPGQRAGAGSNNIALETRAHSAASSGIVPNSVLTVSGYIINRERIELSPRYMGVVNWIGVKKGDAVTNGQVVVLLDDAEYKARLKESEGRLANANAAVALAELTYQRITELAAKDIATRQAEDDARLQLEAARATVVQAQGQKDLSQTYLDWTVIRSPIDGVVLEKLVDPNELVVPQSFGGARGPSTALISLADPKDLQVEIELNESDLSKVFLNQECQVSPEAYPEKVYTGYVAEIAPEANRQKGTLQLKVQIRNPDHFLTPELSAKVDFLSREDAGGLDSGAAENAERPRQ